MDVSPWSLVVAIIELATFDQVENYINEREQLRALTATLRAQMAQAFVSSTAALIRCSLKDRDAVLIWPDMGLFLE